MSTPFRMALVDALVERVFQSHDKDWFKLIERYMRLNNVKLSELSSGFSLYGVDYTKDPYPKFYPRLHDDLVDEFLAELKALEPEIMLKKRVKHYFTSTLNRTTNLEQLRILIPDALHDTFTKINPDSFSPVPMNTLIFERWQNTNSKLVGEIKEQLLLNMILNE